MLLKDKYYEVVSEEHTAECTAKYHVKLKADCSCYEGHFPGKPVSPGVCNIEMIRECAEILTGKDLFITTIKQCRLTEIAAPQICPEVDVTVQVTPNQPDATAYTVVANISDATRSFMDFKGTLTVS